MRWWFCLTHLISSTPLRRNSQIQTGYLQSRQFLAICVFAYAKREFSVYIFIIFVTCFWPSSAVVPQKSTQNVENCSDASKKPSCEEDGIWQKRENTQKYKFMFISSPSARDKNLENFSSCFFVTHQNLASRLREITGFTSAQIPPQKSSK